MREMDLIPYKSEIKKYIYNLKHFTKNERNRFYPLPILSPTNLK